MFSHISQKNGNFPYLNILPNWSQKVVWQLSWNQCSRQQLNVIWFPVCPPNDKNTMSWQFVLSNKYQRICHFWIVIEIHLFSNLNMYVLDKDYKWLVDKKLLKELYIWCGRVFLNFPINMTIFEFIFKIQAIWWSQLLQFLLDNPIIFFTNSYDNQFVVFKFVADGVFKAELNNFLTRELAEDGYSGVEVRVTPTRTEIIILATRTQNVLGEKGRRIRELTSVVQKRFNFPEGTVEVFE